MINLIKELPQNTTVLQSEHTEQYSKSSNQQCHLETVFVVLHASLMRGVDGVHCLEVSPPKIRIFLIPS